MTTENTKVIDVIEKALEANLMTKDENVKRLLVELLETCQDNIGEFCLSNNRVETAEQMRLFYQAMTPVIRKLKDERSVLKGFFETPLEDLKDDNNF